MSGRMVGQPPGDVHTLAGQALALLDPLLPPMDKLDNLDDVRDRLRRIRDLTVDQDVGSADRPAGWDPELDVSEHAHE